MQEEERWFWSQGKRSQDGCILWQGKIDIRGYGRMGPTITGSVYAHRSAWILARGPIPQGMTIDHACHSESDCRAGDNCQHRRCINPDHMRLLTLAENLKLRKARERKLTCPQGHPRRAQPNGQWYCPTCQAVAQEAWREKPGNRDRDNAARKARRHKGPSPNPQE